MSYWGSLAATLGRSSRPRNTPISDVFRAQEFHLHVTPL